jgi:hypothetical protein
MITYIPLDIGLAFDGRRSDLNGFDWRNRTADFVMPDDDMKVLRVEFGGNTIVRLLDEMPSSIETDHTTWVGLIPGHFAYQVQGHPLLEGASPTWKGVFTGMRQFAFITGWGCLDALTEGDVTFSVVPAQT